MGFGDSWQLPGGIRRVAASPGESGLRYSEAKLMPELQMEINGL